MTKQDSNRILADMGINVPKIWTKNREARKELQHAKMCAPENLYGFRSYVTGWRGFCFGLSPTDALTKIDEGIMYDPSVYMSESPNDALGTILGEYDGWNLSYIDVSDGYGDLRGLSVRDVPNHKRRQHKEGIDAKALLLRRLDDPSWDAMQELVAQYPGCSIEFSTYTTLYGSEGWNTLFWEVRDDEALLRTAFRSTL